MVNNLNVLTFAWVMAFWHNLALIQLTRSATTLRIMTLKLVTVTIMGLSVMTIRINCHHVTGNCNGYHKNTKYNDTQHTVFH